MFEKFNLKDNSFPVTPSDPNEIRWFGFNNLKREFQTILERSGSEHLRLCVLNRGRLGAGKTHAAQYFSAQYSQRKDVDSYFRFIPIIIESPKQPQKAFVDFSNRLFNAVTFDRIFQASNNLRKLGDANKLLFDATGSEDIATTLSRIDNNNRLLTRAYLLGGGTAKELRDLGVAKRLASDHEFALAIVGMLYLLIHGQSGERETFSRILLWIDEMEDLVYFTTRYYLSFTQALREVIDRTNSHLTLMLNFTFSEPEDLPAIESVLGQAIMQRVNLHVMFQPPDANEMRDYLLDLLKHNRVEDTPCSPTFPFSNDAFDLLIKSAISRTPRFFNKLCDTLLRDLKDDSTFDIRKTPEIQRGVLEERLPRLLARLEEESG